VWLIFRVLGLVEVRGVFDKAFHHLLIGNKDGGVTESMISGTYDRHHAGHLDFVLSIYCFNDGALFNLA